MAEKKTNSFFKRLVGFLHFLFACVTLVGIGFMYLNSNYGRGLDWIKTETFEQSPDFSKKVQADITNIFDYVQYQDIFEVNGEVDYSQVVLEVTTGPGGEKSYTLDDIIQYGKSLGYYMDESDNYALKGGPETLSEEDQEQVYVRYRCYQSEEDLTSPDQSFSTMPDLTYEILRRFSSYYSIYSRLMSDFTNLYFRVAYYSKNNAIYEIHTNAPEMSNDDIMAMGRYIYYSGDSNDLAVRTNFESNFPSIPALMSKNNPYNGNSYYVVIGLDTSYKANDDYAQAYTAYNKSRVNFSNGLYITIAGLAGSLVTFAFLLFLSGHASISDRTITLYPFDRTKTDFMLLLMAFVSYLCIHIMAPVTSKLLHLVVVSDYWDRANLLVAFGYLYFCSILTFFSLLRRYKAETLWKNSFLHDLTETLSESTFRYRITIGFVLYLAYNVFMITVGAFMIFHHENSVFQFMPFIFVMIAWIAGNLLVFYFIYRNADQTDKIHAAIEKLASGETSYKVDVNDFSSLEAELAEGLNRISDGLETALAEQVKSERLKADLITNVSHDIKTPLTSIINYVGLLKTEGLKSDNAEKYLEVIDRKSIRLKNLTEDLVEASKLNAGAINFEMQQIDIVQLVNQSLGEYEEKFEEKHLTVMKTIQEEPLYVMPDGRKTWRVFENLYGNIYKYAMDNTRVYVDITRQNDKVVIFIRNISASPLNFNAKELTERFVRGDKSRTTEGSGLGLSIAKSIVEKQNGQMNIYLDGDLFKVEIMMNLKQA